MPRRLQPLERALTIVGLIVVGLFVLIPLYGFAQLAFDASLTGQPLEFRLWPKAFSLSVFQAVWGRVAAGQTFVGALRNSLIVSGGAAALSLALGASMAYVFARLRFPGQRAGLFALLIGAMLPPVALMTPLYILLTAFKIRTTLLGLALVYTAFAMPFAVWNLRAAFQAVPRELEESAFLDGASFLRAFWNITLPLALPAMGVAALLAFLAGYTEFAMGWLFVEKSDTVTLAMATSSYITQGSVRWNQLAALALLMSLPVVAVFLLVQRSLLGSLSGGLNEESS
jgi:arabinogalactan oligomer/maltooligosaccharide transport system permease protein